MKCLIVANTMSGNYDEKRVAALEEKYSEKSHTDVVRLTTPSDIWSANGYDTVVVCGGDGTIGRALNICANSSVQKVVCVPCGTLNEAQKLPRGGFVKVGNASGRRFSYVLAAGSCTEIGYLPSQNSKKRFKALSYASKIAATFRPQNFKAELDVDGKKFGGETTLLMAINSDRCFGFRFNRAYDPENGNLHLLWVRGVDPNAVFAEIRLFRLFFRAFFVGFSKPYFSKDMVFVPFSRAKIKLQQPTVFCSDGEKTLLPSVFTIRSERTPFKIYCEE